MLNMILPKEVNNEYKGHDVAKTTFLVITIISVIRSLIHIFASDGGFNSIAGLDISRGANEIIFVFALWGSAQLIQAIIQLVVYYRYKSLISFMYVIIILEYVLRIFVGQIKVISFEHIPPGMIANYLVIIISSIMFKLSLKKN